MDSRVRTVRRVDEATITYTGACYNRLVSTTTVHEAVNGTSFQIASLAFDTSKYSQTMVGSDNDVRPKSSTVRFLIHY